jgi:hypothetical protein
MNLTSILSLVDTGNKRQVYLVTRIGQIVVPARQWQKGISCQYIPCSKRRGVQWGWRWHCCQDGGCGQQLDQVSKSKCTELWVDRNEVMGINRKWVRTWKNLWVGEIRVIWG